MARSSVFSIHLAGGMREDVLTGVAGISLGCRDKGDEGDLYTVRNLSWTWYKRLNRCTLNSRQGQELGTDTRNAGQERNIVTV